MITPDLIQVNTPIELKTIDRQAQNRQKTKTPRKYAKHGQSNLINPNKQAVDYADVLKSIVNPAFYDMYEGRQHHFSQVYTTNVLLFLDERGNIKSMKVNTSSGNKEFDQLALDVLSQSTPLPPPPKIVVDEGITWSFSNGR
jgi:TonB family protein